MNISQQPSFRSARRGFSLVEVVVAIGVLALLLAGFLAIFTPAANNIKRSIGVKEANRLAETLTNEMGVLRANQTTTYDSAFEKAFEWIKDSNEATKAVVLYTYKATPFESSFAGTSTADTDGNLEPFIEDGAIGRDYIAQTVARRVGDQDSLIEKEIDPKALIGNVYVMRMCQLVRDERSTAKQLIMKATDYGTIYDDPEKVGNGATVVTDVKNYQSAVLPVQAEIYVLPSNSYKYLINGTWSFEKIGEPLTTINLAISR